MNWTKIFKLQNRYKITNNRTKYLNLKQYNKIFKIQKIWQKFNIVGLSLHGEDNFFLMAWDGGTWNITLVDPVLGYSF